MKTTKQEQMAICSENTHASLSVWPHPPGGWWWSWSGGRAGLSWRCWCHQWLSLPRLTLWSETSPGLGTTSRLLSAPRCQPVGQEGPGWNGNTGIWADLLLLTSLSLTSHRAVQSSGRPTLLLLYLLPLAASRDIPLGAVLGKGQGLPCLCQLFLEIKNYNQFL